MKIGELVKRYREEIFQFCEAIDHDELTRLMDKKYSKDNFGINYPFCTELTSIKPEKSKRYWEDMYLVRGKTVRVSSQWFKESRDQFVQYLISNNISTSEAISSLGESVNFNKIEAPRSIGKNSRYRGNAIGNAQNLLVRNILSNLGQESFNDKDWADTKKYFSNQCAYCGAEGELVIDHIIPINRVSLGEHRLGNLIPSCKPCNAKKSNNNYREFLGSNKDKIEKIEQYMESRNYVPLGDNKQVAMILNIAYEEVAAVSKRYISILNETFA